MWFLCGCQDLISLQNVDQGPIYLCAKRRKLAFLVGKLLYFLSLSLFYLFQQNSLPNEFSDK